MKSICIVASMLAPALGHAVMSQVSHGDQTGCSMYTAGCTPTNGLHTRKIIGRTGNTGKCAKPPGCEAPYNCDWCGLEKVLLEGSQAGGPSNKWWTQMPAAHWDQPMTQPQNPCMSKDSFGDRGLMSVNLGSEISTKIYINADHSGLYRFELSCGNEATNARFSALPLTPWKQFHKNKEGVTNLDRIVGYTRADTDAYFKATTCTGANCGLRMNRGNKNPDDAHCVKNPDDCFVEDTFTIPVDACGGSGDATLRWFWPSAEGPEVYANCLDLNFGGDKKPPAVITPTDEPVYVVPSNPTNTASCFEGEPCAKSPACCPVGQACFEKDPYWASCRLTCSPGIDPNDSVEYQTPWSCNLLGGDVNAPADVVEGPNVKDVEEAPVGASGAAGIGPGVAVGIATFLLTANAIVWTA